MEKPTLDFVKKEFAKVGYKLTEKEYKNSYTPMNYICHKQHKCKMTWHSFKNGHRCRQCYFDSKRLDIKFVSNEFEKIGYTLLEKEYINKRTPMKYLCHKEHNGETTWANFQQGHRCKQCADDNQKYTLDDVKKYLDTIGYMTISEAYVNNKEKLDIICIRDHYIQINFNDLLSGKGCRQCSYDDMKIKYDVIKAEFEKHGCKLLTTNYTGNSQKLKYICVCENIAYTRYHHMKNGILCGCGKSRGEKIIRKYLQENDIEYIPQKSFSGCAYVCLLRFDFYVCISDIKFLVEFDGRQHFEPIEYFGGEKALVSTKNKDDIKNNYCINKEIQLLRISYKQMDEIDDILDDYIKKLKKNKIKNIITFGDKSLYEDMKSRIDYA